MHRSSLNHKRGKHQSTTEQKCFRKNSTTLQSPQNKHPPPFTKLSPHDDFINVNHSITRRFNTKPNSQVSPPSTQTPHPTTRHSRRTQISKHHSTDHHTVVNSDILLNPITINIQSQFPNSNLDQSLLVHTSHLATIPPSKLSHRCNRIPDISDKAAIHTTTTHSKSPITITTTTTTTTTKPLTLHNNLHYRQNAPPQSKFPQNKLKSSLKTATKRLQNQLKNPPTSLLSI